MRSGLRGLAFGTLLVIGLTLLGSPSWAQGLVVVEKFSAGSTQLNVAQYTHTTGERVGLVSIRASTQNSFAFTLNEWDMFIEICTKAAAVDSTGWKVVDRMTEVGTTDVSQITISAGPGMRFVIMSPKEGTVAYSLPKSDLPRFQDGLRKVRDYMSAGGK